MNLIKNEENFGWRQSHGIIIENKQRKCKVAFSHSPRWYHPHSNCPSKKTFMHFKPNVKWKLSACCLYSCFILYTIAIILLWVLCESLIKNNYCQAICVSALRPISVTLTQNWLSQVVVRSSQFNSIIIKMLMS